MGGLSKRGLIIDVNITSLIDVTMTVLIIFMISAPNVQHGVEVDVPQATFAPMEGNEDQVIISVTKNGDIYINKYKVGYENLELKLSKLFERASNKEVFIQADKDVRYETVIKAMAAIRNAGITKIGMVTEPDAE